MPSTGFRWNELLGMKGANRLGMRAGNNLRLGVSQKLDPRMILGTKLVLMDQVELEERISQELAENPALERLDGEESFFVSSEVTATSQDDPYFKSRESERSLPSGDFEFDMMAAIGNRSTLEEHLLAQLSNSLPSALLHVAEVVVGSIDRRGYLSLEDEQLAIVAETTLEVIAEVIVAVQACQPAGVGARNVQECLCLQLRCESGPVARLGERMIMAGGTDFMRRDIVGLRRRLKVRSAEIEAAYELIQTLDPYPGEQYESPETAAPFRALAEIGFERTESGWQVEIRGARARDFSLNRAYLQLSNDGPSDDRKHARHFLDRAKMFVEGLEQREQTLGRIAAFLIEHQSAFLATGQYRYLTDLTRAQMAVALGIDAGTITRATKGKCIRIATGEVVPYSVIFDAKLRAQELISELLAQERPNKPWTDDEIANHLRSQGIIAARRTVSKYRNRARLLSSRSRKVA
jgi:RNA polymerase sigma-54 factor